MEGTAVSWLLGATPPPEGTTSLDEAHETATNAAGWFEENWSDWLAAGLRMLLILAIAVVLRYVVRRAISKFLRRMNRNAAADASGNALRGLLVNHERRRQRSEAIGSVLRSVTTIVIMGTAALIVMSTLGIDLAPLLASAGVAGVALGFGARNLVTDVLTGTFMLLEDQYGVGDRIDAGEATGTVLEIGLRVTKLRGVDGEIWYVRNGEIKRVGNLSQGWATAGVDVQVRADEDLETVREAISMAGEEMSKSQPWDEVLWAPVEVLGLDSVTLESMVVRVSVRTMPDEALGVERELRWRIKRELDRRGIRIVDDESLALEAARRPANDSGPVRLQK
ncbi:mechanosensitive ion channel family protein [Streptomyces sp. N2-109]|uniref:Mechanosensitive ion channel family protein n=1 Tax=Streptomyces gossypii TaxID=2883101 RepID=A0ABT2JRH3_9ACTN|nr:mechanosensitive ion channel family protein [Streptomyces gossypii]MCT2590492.1 mechanosensitive ion channel family protein [Streptomyces gossypii]